MRTASYTNHELEDTQMAIARVYIVRHGETDENRAGVVQGQLDTALNDVGLEQARLVGAALQSIPFDVAYSSDLRRASKTAEAILTHHPHLQLRAQEELREKFMGELQGKRLAESAKMSASFDSTNEGREAFSSRTITWWNKSVLQYASSLATRSTPYNILVITHGGFIGTLVKTLIRSRKAECAHGVVIWKCFNASVTSIEIEGDGKGLVTKYGDIAHLTEKKVVETNADEVDG